MLCAQLVFKQQILWGVLRGCVCDQAKEKEALGKLRMQLDAEQAVAGRQRAELEAAAQKVVTLLLAHPSVDCVLSCKDIV